MNEKTTKLRSKFNLDLDKSRAPRAFRGPENLWEDDLRRIYRLVKQQIAVLQEKKRESRHRELRSEQVPHLSIAVFGPSGSGKSSLLRTLADDTARDSGGILGKDLCGKVHSLPVMDPTTWSTIDQFLYAFLATALEAEQKRQDEKDRTAPQGLSPVQLAFQEVNEYLRVVDDPGIPEEHDPLGLSLQKLERHTSGLRLRQALGKFVDALADEFGSKVVLLPVDDLDMAPDHLVESLQAYQSFLAHPRLVPIFTFTDRMPEELIEVYYEKRLGGRREPSRSETTGDRLDVNEQLAVQFLARCFPVRNRIRLGPAPARVQRAVFGFRPEFGAKRSSESKEKEELKVLELLITSSFLLFGYPDEEDAHQVRAALRPSTLRRQFQVVDAMADCRIPALRVPQLAKMANSDIDSGTLEELRVGSKRRREGDNPKDWGSWPSSQDRLDKLWQDKLWQDKLWHTNQMKLLGEERRPEGHLTLGWNLRRLEIGATWATIFNGAVWSLLNVHRDILRELGLFLEDLYSWSPKELRSVVLEKILAQDRTVRRTVIDRWFNRTDFRRSQVLSLLAANIFRPWMIGEEPYGDEELTVRKQIQLEEDYEESDPPPLDRHWDGEDSEDKKEQIRERLSFRATDGFLWFLNVTLGFYLPQIMTRNWADALSSDEPVRGRMSGNGWDLRHAPINAMRIADARQEIFSFGMLFLDPRGYRHALEAITYQVERGNKAQVWRGENPTERGHLMLRIWSCCGYSKSRYWAAFSLWRGLGFIGQLLELASKHRDRIEKLVGLEDDDARLRLHQEIRRLIHSHCLAGLVPGALLDRGSNDERLLQGFPRWEPLQPWLDQEIDGLARDLVKWLTRCWSDRIFPFPAGDVWIGWRDCFIRRIHGEYILGGLWPRLNAAYLEEHERYDCQLLARRRAFTEERIQEAGDYYSDSQEENLEHEERFRWTAALAAGAWSDILLEYWRGCPQILRLFLTCPIFYKSRERFQSAGKKGKRIFQELRKGGKGEDFQGEEKARFDWLKRLSYPAEGWKELTNDDGELLIGEIVPDELCVERVRVERFASRPVQHRSISIERTEIEVGKPPAGEDGKPEPLWTGAGKSVSASHPEIPTTAKKEPTKSSGKSTGGGKKKKSGKGERSS